MGVVEYFNEDAVGFMRFPLNPTWKSIGNGEIKKFSGRALIFTSTYCPDATNWYAMAQDTTNTKNILIHFDLNEASNKAEVWELDAHATLHTHSVILPDNSLFGSTDNLPVSGYYVGATQSF